MRAWHELLCFGDAHPWFLPSLAAVFTLLGVAYKGSTWFRLMIRNRWERLEDDIAAGYLMSQINTGSLGPDKYGHSQPLQKPCTLFQVAFFLKKQPHKARAILERLEHQMRAKRRGDMWQATDYQMRQSIGSFTKIRLYFLRRSCKMRVAKLNRKAEVKGGS